MVEKGKRRLAAIMFADMVGYTALMQKDEDEARLQRDRHRKLISLAVESRHGEILQYYGDGTLSMFDSAVEAVECAIEIQQAAAQESIIPLRIGVHIGDIVQEDDGLLGDGVNLASRIEALAAPGGIAVSAKVFDEIKNHSSISTLPLGSFRLKNVSYPVTVYAISNAGLSIPENVAPQGSPEGDAQEERRYTDEEVETLLARATALEKDKTALLARTEGPSLPELEAIAQEAGMNPLAVREAARRLEMEAQGGLAPQGMPRGFLGAPLTVQMKRSVAGEPNTSALEAMASILGRASEGFGEPVIQGNTLTCHSTNKESMRSLTVTVVPVGGATQLVMEERYANLAWAIHGGFIGGLGFGVGIPVAFGVGFGIGMGGLALASFLTGVPIALLGGGYFLSRKIYSMVVRRRSGVLNDLMDEMVAVMEGAQNQDGQGRLSSGGA